MTINRYSPNWLDELHERLSKLLLEFPQTHIYALIEGVLDESCYRHLKRSKRLPYFALYANTPGADEETLGISPLLVEYRAEARDTWNALLDKTDGKPALSLIATQESLMELAQRLTPWCIVNADGYTLALSFADTRILPELCAVLTPLQHAQFFGPAHCWQYVTRAASWATLPLPKSNASPAREVALDQRQCAQLMAAAEADNILHQLRTATAAAIVDCHAPARAHELVRHWLTCADRARISATPDRIGLCEWGLQHAGMENHLQVADWLAMRHA